MKQQENNTDLLQDETLSQKLIKKGFWLYLFSYLIAPGGYLIRLLISNSPEVSVADVGILYSIISLISFLNVYNDLGLTESLQYFLPKFWIKKEYNHIKTTIWISLGVQILSSLIIILGLRFWSDWLAQNYFQHENAAIILKYFCRYFVGINLFQTLQTIFMAFQKTFDYQIVDFIRTWIIVWFTLFCFFNKHATIKRYSLGWILGVTIWIIIAIVIYYRNYQKSLMQGKFEWDKPMLKEYGLYALWAFIGVNVANLFGQIIQQMVIFFLGPEDAWYYTNFLSLFLIGNTIIWPIMGLIFPVVSELGAKKDHNKLWLLFSFFYNYFSIITISLSLLFILLGPEIANSLFWKEYIISGKLLSVNWIFLLFNILSWFNYSVLAWLGEIKGKVKILIKTLILVIGIGLIGIKTNWIYGAWISFGTSYLILFILSSTYLRKLTKVEIEIRWRFILKNLLFCIIMSIWIAHLKWELNLSWLNRWEYLWALIGIWIIYYFLLGIVNYKQISWLRNELSKIKIKTKDE